MKSYGTRFGSLGKYCNATRQKNYRIHSPLVQSQQNGHICESLVMCHTGGSLNRDHLDRGLGRLDLHVDRLCSGQLIESCSHTQPYTSASDSISKAAQNATPVLTESRQADPTSTVLDTRPTQGRIRGVGPVQKDGARLELAREHVERVGGFLVLDVGPHRGGLREFLTGSVTI
jgi:hypothetical protein